MIIRLFIFSIFFYSCTTIPLDYYEEDLLSDGKTWRVSVELTNACKNVSNVGDPFDSLDQQKEKISQKVNECLKTFEPKIQNRGTILCGHNPKRVFGCLFRQIEISGKNIRQVATCYAECDK